MGISAKNQVGALGILNVGAGDTKLSFDPQNEAEAANAARIVSDMLRRGYAILIEVGVKDGRPLYQRAEGFDPQTREYIIVGTPEGKPLATAEKAVPRGTRSKVRVPAATTRGISVARSAGG